MAKKQDSGEMSVTIAVGDVMLDSVMRNPVKVLELGSEDEGHLVDCEAEALKGHPFRLPASRLIQMPVSDDAPAEA